VAKTGLVGIETQLLAARKRMFSGHVEGGLWEASSRLHHLERALSKLDVDNNSEVLRHFPVAAIAVLETHFKSTIQAIVDAGPDYLERGLALTKDRLKAVSEILPLIHKKSVTIGELVAHQLPFNSVASLEDGLSPLLGEKLKVLIAGACDPHQVRNDVESPQLLVENVDMLWRDIAQTFERRHILAHESASNYVVTREDAMTAIECVFNFTTALDAVLWSTVRKHEPLTQYEMNVDAWNSYRNTRNVVAKRLRHAWAIAKNDGENTVFYALHQKWRTYARAYTELEGEKFGFGSIRPMIIAQTSERLLRARAEDIENWIAWARPEDQFSI
jgi:hypothetical protein